MQTNNIKYSSEALKDLKCILKFYLTKNKKYALKIVNYLEEQMLLLTKFSNLGKKINNPKISVDLLVFIIKDFLIFYKRENNTILIHRVIHSKQNYKNIL